MADQLIQTTTGPAGAPVAGAPLGRRRFLRTVGLSVGTVAVAGATGITWKAVDGGVFATGTGPAYAAWDAPLSTGRDPMTLVRAAVLAANAHNAQPWHFVVAPDRIDLFADPTRTLGTMDPLLREMHISLGCALENMMLTAPAAGLAATVTLLPDPADPGHVARVDLLAGAGPVSPLFATIPDRHTDRAAYDTSRPLEPARLVELTALVTATDTRLVWFTDPAQMRTFGDLTVRATEAINADTQQSTDDFAWYRTGWAEIQDRKDGITIDPSGKSPLIRAVAKLLPVTHQQSNDGWLSGTRDVQIPTAAAFGALVVGDRTDPTQRLEAGRSWQRVHLAATAAGLSMQPLCQIPERIDREQTAGLPADITTAMTALVPGGQYPIMTFRIGHPTTDAPRSPRRPAADVVLA